MGQCQGTSWHCQGRHGKEKQLAVNALKFEMLVQATMASTGSALVGLAVPTWASLQVNSVKDITTIITTIITTTVTSLDITASNTLPITIITTTKGTTTNMPSHHDLSQHR